MRNVDSFVILPIAPRRIFIAARDQENLEKIQRLPHDVLVRRTNEIIASQAHKYVYGTNDGQLRFVENRLGRGLAEAFTLRGVPQTAG